MSCLLAGATSLPTGCLLDPVLFFEFGGCLGAERAGQPGAVVPGDVFPIARRAMARVGQAGKSINSPLSEAKNDSEMALMLL
jgi:hypothetical protein